MRPCRATRAGTQAPPLPNSIIIFHAIPHKQNNHLRAICPNETVGAVPACPPERPRSGVSIPRIHALCAGMNDGCALAGRRGRAHRHRPYQSPSYFSTQSHTNKITHSTRNLPKRNQPSLPIPTKPRGVPIPHRGYTFDSAGLASVTQPTLGNDVREEATPLGLYFFSSHILTTRGE